MASKAAMLRLIEYLDRYPLRARKQQDYEVWRSAVLIYSASSRQAPELPALAERIGVLKHYAGR